jgi:hypothetical protein
MAADTELWPVVKGKGKGLPQQSELAQGKGKGLSQQAELAQGVPGRLRRRIFLTFGTTRVVGRQP